MNHEYSAGGIVINGKGDIVIVNQKGISWSFPKGHIEQGENEERAARREIYEETGINNLKIIKSLGFFERPVRDKHGKPFPDTIKRIHMFLCHTDHSVLQPIDPDNPEAQWVTREKALILLTHPEDKAFLSNIIRELGLDSFSDVLY